MSDEIDRAQDIQQSINDDAIARQLRKSKVTPTDFCIDCDDEIPQVRKNIGACRCIECQTLYEKASATINRF